MSVAYCASLGAAEWTEVTHFIDAVRVPSVHGVVNEAEIAAFDDGREYSAGMYKLSSRDTIRPTN